MLGFRPRSASRRAWRRLVAWWQRQQVDERCRHDPDQPSPLMGEHEADAARRVDPQRLDHAGSGGRRLRERVRRTTSARRTPAPSPTAPPPCTWRCSPLGVGPATRSSPSATPSSPPPTPSATAARRRCSSTSIRGTFNIDPALIEAAITPRTRAILCVHQIGMPCDLAAHRARSRAAHGLPGDRGRRLRHRQRAPMARASGSRSAGRTATSPASRSTRAR